MREVAAPLAVARAREVGLARALNSRLALSWEAVAYAGLLVVGFGMRFWDLGARALHHDESLHGYYAYQIFQGHGYEHSPLLHGPLQLFGMALTFALAGGASDYTVRVLPALFGTALIALPLLFRSQLGRVGALAAAALIAFSPTLLYYSRFAREDIYVAVFTLGLVVCLWRFIAEQRERYLYVGAGLLALSFATKETTFITAAILLTFLNLWVASELARQTRERKNPGRVTHVVCTLAYVLFAWAIVALWPVIGGWRRRLGLEERNGAMDVLLVLGTLAGPQFAAAIKLPIEATGIELDTLAEERLVGFPTVAGLLLASAVVGLRWNRRVWLIAAACFYAPYTLLFTSFLTNIDGFGSGIWQSLDYWLGQHEVRRADQPDFYYLMFFPMYEFLALAFAGPTLLYYSLRGGLRSWLLTAMTVASLLAFFGADSFGGGVVVRGLAFAGLPLAAVALFFAVRGTMFERFLVFWAVATLVAYSFVGEKMPWLSVHTGLPMIVLAAYTVGRLLRGPPIAREVPYRGRLGAVGTSLRQLGRRRLALSVVMAALAVLSIRIALLAAYDHGDVPREFLFYTQTAPDVPDVVERIERLAESSGKGHDLRIQVDRAYPWPWAWYLRDYDDTYVPVDGAFLPEPGAVLLLAAENDVQAGAYRSNYEPAQPYVLRWFFPEDLYRSAGNKANLGEAIGDFGLDLRRADTWRDWWDYFIERDVTPRVAVEGRLYIPLEYGALDLGTTPPVVMEEPEIRPTADLEGRFIIGRLGSEPGQMEGPVGVALDVEGNVYVVDSGNSRIQKFDARGALVGSVGEAGGETGQFNQPSDIAVDAAGNVYVADTWNHRIQKFAPDLSFVAQWGKPTRDLINPGPDEMWGPRGIAVDQDGNVLVTDTGTHRVRKFGPDGAPITVFGRRGKDAGEFEEPVGIAVGPDGSIYVADAGNARIQKFDAGFAFVAAYPVEGWSDRDGRNKPHLEALPDGRLIATDGPHGRLLLIDQEGKLQAHLDTMAEVPLFFPGGIAYDGARGFVYVTDGLAGHVRRFPFTDFALR